jgi:hypothetical protein
MGLWVAFVAIGYMRRLDVISLDGIFIAVGILVGLLFLAVGILGLRNVLRFYSVAAQPIG